MEFYRSVSEFDGVSNTCFNSQRDGILLSFRTSSPTLSIVSIPNGMEFYHSANIALVQPKRVSIPNGMEFYRFRVRTRRSVGSSFNSQRDGILLISALLWSIPFSAFQFPTGWNSTSRFGVIIAILRSFNSQRDGILLNIDHTLVGEIMFQFPTGWNSTMTKSLS